MPRASASRWTAARATARKRPRRSSSPRSGKAAKVLSKLSFSAMNRRTSAGDGLAMRPPCAGRRAGRPSGVSLLGRALEDRGDVDHPPAGGAGVELGACPELVVELRGQAHVAAGAGAVQHGYHHRPAALVDEVVAAEHLGRDGLRRLVATLGELGLLLGLLPDGALD